MSADTEVDSGANVHLSIGKHTTIFYNDLTASAIFWRIR
jgi:hypothetical protein